MSVLPTLGISARDLADCFEVCLLRSFPNHTSWILHATRRRRWLRRSLPLAAMVSRPGRTNEAARGTLLKSYRCMAEVSCFGISTIFNVYVATRRFFLLQTSRNMEVAFGSATWPSRSR